MLMDKPLQNFPEFHRELLTLFNDVRKASPSAVAPLVRSRLQMLRNQIMDSEDEAVYTAFENYLSYYAKSISDPSMHDLLTLVDPKKIEAEIDKDPSRYDRLLSLARCYIAKKRCDEARIILKKIAASRFSESKEAQFLLERLTDESMK